VGVTGGAAPAGIQWNHAKRGSVIKRHRGVSPPRKWSVPAKEYGTAFTKRSAKRPLTFNLWKGVPIWSQSKLSCGIAMAPS